MEPRPRSVICRVCRIGFRTVEDRRVCDTCGRYLCRTCDGLGWISPPGDDDTIQPEPCPACDWSPGDLGSS